MQLRHNTHRVDVDLSHDDVRVLRPPEAIQLDAIPSLFTCSGAPYSQVTFVELDKNGRRVEAVLAEQREAGDGRVR
jgi:hypothetical protein